MDGMRVGSFEVSSLGQGDGSFSHTITLDAPTSVIAEISVCSFASYAGPPSAFATFTACTTDGSSDPASEVFATSTNPNFPTVLIRNGLKTITYELDVENCRADYCINVFFWPQVVHG